MALRPGLASGGWSSLAVRVPGRASPGARGGSQASVAQPGGRAVRWRSATVARRNRGGLVARIRIASARCVAGLRRDRAAFGLAWSARASPRRRLPQPPEVTAEAAPRRRAPRRDGEHAPETPPASPGRCPPFAVAPRGPRARSRRAYRMAARTRAGGARPGRGPRTRAGGARPGRVPRTRAGGEARARRPEAQRPKASPGPPAGCHRETERLAESGRRHEGCRVRPRARSRSRR